MQSMLWESVKALNVCTATEGAANTTDISTDIVDTAGHDGVAWAVTFGAITSGAVTSVKIQQGDAANLSDAADLEGSGVTVADDDDAGLVLVEVARPMKRYLRLVIDRGTQNAVVENVTAYLYRATEQPVTQDASVISTESHLSPAEGTA